MRQDMRETLIRWRDGQTYPTGSFLEAVLANDLMGAFAYADEDNREHMFDFAMFLYNDMPGRTGNPDIDIWGSYEAIKNTLKRRNNALTLDKPE